MQAHPLRVTIPLKRAKNFTLTVTIAETVYDYYYPIVRR